MRRLVLTVLMVAGVGCGNQGQSLEKGASEDGGISSASHAQADAESWVVETAQSGIDGETRTASRVYAFPDRRVQFQVAVSCAVGTGATELNIDSFVGDPRNPEDGSAFLMQGMDVRFMSPVGRVKAGDGNVTELRSYFSLGGDYNNRLKFDFNNPIAASSIRDAPGYNSLVSTFEEGDVNYARLLLAALPMTIEVKNGAGEFELQIDKSEELQAALQSCGAGKPLLSAAYGEKVHATEQSAHSEVLKNIRNICGYRGVVRETSEPWVETAKRLSVSLDCAQSAPEEFASFNAKIDAYLGKAHERGIACTREALVHQAEQAGVEDSFLWSSYLEQYCSS